MRRYRVLIVDDSRSMRQLIASVLSAAPDIDVVGEAADALEAREAIKALNPDVVTLDVEMPKMNGLDFLEKLMRLRPTPVIMVSNHTSKSTELAFRALEIGAVDCIAKPQPGERTIFEGLPDKIRIAGETKFGLPVAKSSVVSEESPRANYRPDGRIVAIGASAGGIEALSAVLDGFPTNCPPVVITQHMPANFTKSLANRLGRLCDAKVAEAEGGELLEPGCIYVAPGGDRHLTITGSDKLYCRLNAGATVSGHRPSVDVMFHSVAAIAGPTAIGVILSGMGRDGADGLLAMRRAGAKTIGQDAATCFIYGMPKMAFEAGGVERQLPLSKISSTLLAMTSLQAGQRPCR